MTPLTVCTFKWTPRPGYRSVFTAQSVLVLRSMIARNYPSPHRFVCITDDPKGLESIETIPLWRDHADLKSPHGPLQPSCYRRLKIYSAEIEALLGPRFVSIDLDTVITGDLRPVWDRPEDFVIYGETDPRSFYNGSMVLMTAGARRQVWDRFHPVKSPREAHAAGRFGSDQGWISHCLGKGERIWTRADGVYSFNVHLRYSRALPTDARVVMFHGSRDPWSPAVQAQYPWVAQHWR